MFYNNNVIYIAPVKTMLQDAQQYRAIEHSINNKTIKTVYNKTMIK